MLSSDLKTARTTIIERLEREVPHVTWFQGRLPDSVADRVRTLGAISTISQAQVPDRTWSIDTIGIQVFLPFDDTGEGFSDTHVRDPNEIEELVDEILTALQAVSLDGPDWYFRWTRTDYPPDPSGQQSRAEIYFQSYKDSSWD